MGARVLRVPGESRLSGMRLLRKHAATTRSAVLRELALRLVPRLVRDGALGVAITGSVARGTATAGSDLDLWVLGPPERRRHVRVAGENVTFLTHTPREALDLDVLASWEVDDLDVLYDGHGHFARVQATFARHRAALRKDVLAATRVDLLRELSLAADGSTWKRLLFLRQAGLRIAMVWLYLRTGWRVPRYRLLVSQLPVRARRELERLLDLPSGAEARRALLEVRPVAERARRWLRARRVDASALVPPRELEARRRAGEVDEAVVQARRFLTEALVPSVLEVGEVMDVTALGAFPRGLRALLFALQRFDGVGETDSAALHAAARRVRALVRTLALERALGPKVRAALDRALRAGAAR